MRGEKGSVGCGAAMRPKQVADVFGLQVGRWEQMWEEWGKHWQVVGLEQKRLFSVKVVKFRPVFEVVFT